MKDRGSIERGHLLIFLLAVFLASFCVFHLIFFVFVLSCASEEFEGIAAGSCVSIVCRMGEESRRGDYQAR